MLMQPTRRAILETMEARRLLASVPAGFADGIYASGLDDPTSMAFAPDGRLFVTEQGGAVRVITDGTLKPAPFTTVVTDPTGERGLLGLAFDPAFEDNGFVYVYYTVPGTPAHNRLSRFTADGDVALPGSEQILLELEPLSTAINHNGGAIHFGPDGKLYVAVGDNANSANAQSLATRLGKVLRINADGTIPPDNPFFDEAEGDNRAIWAMGLRNPFTFAFDPPSGRMFINDVGQNRFEEINAGAPGRNFAWPLVEGPFSPSPSPELENPVYTYARGTGPTQGRAVAGGVFYRGDEGDAAAFGRDYDGDYFFSDFGGGWIRRLEPFHHNRTSDFAEGIAAPVDLDVGPDSALYYLERGAGRIGRIAFGEEQVPLPRLQRQAAPLIATSGSMSIQRFSGRPPRLALDVLDLEESR